MPLAIELWLDKKSDASIRDLWSRLEDHGVSTLATFTHGQHAPHISLVVGEKLATSERGVIALLQSAPLLTLCLSALGLFPNGVAFLAVTHNSELAHLQSRVHSSLVHRGAVIWPHYQPEVWVPHCTLSMKLLDRDLAITRSEVDRMLPLVIEVARVCVVDIDSGSVDGSWPTIAY